MTEQIGCPKCGQNFSPSKKDQKLLKESKQKQMTFVMVECSACGRLVSVNPSSSSAETNTKKSKTRNLQSKPLRCPAPGCGGWVTLVCPSEGDKPFWGCGECGSMWYTESKLFEDIENIIKKYPYRKCSYIKEAGKYIPAALREENEHYDDLVEKEPKDKARSYVRS